MKHARVIALALALVLGTAVTGCGPESRAVDESAPPAVEATETTAPAEPEIPPTSTQGNEGLDAAGIDAELGAMERELDQLDMPSDADLSDVENAVP